MVGRPETTLLSDQLRQHPSARTRARGPTLRGPLLAVLKKRERERPSPEQSKAERERERKRDMHIPDKEQPTHERLLKGESGGSHSSVRGGGHSNSSKTVGPADMPTARDAASSQHETLDRPQPEQAISQQHDGGEEPQQAPFSFYSAAARSTFVPVHRDTQRAGRSAPTRPTQARPKQPPPQPPGDSETSWLIEDPRDDTALVQTGTPHTCSTQQRCRRTASSHMPRRQCLHMHATRRHGDNRAMHTKPRNEARRKGSGTQPA